MVVLQRFLDIQQHPNLLGIIIIITIDIIIIIMTTLHVKKKNPINSEEADAENKNVQ